MPTYHVDQDLQYYVRYLRYLHFPDSLGVRLERYDPLRKSVVLNKTFLSVFLSQYDKSPHDE